MAKIIEIESYDLIRKTSLVEHINADQIIKLEEVKSFDDTLLTRIKFINGEFLDTKSNIDDIIKTINE